MKNNRVLKMEELSFSEKRQHFSFDENRTRKRPVICLNSFFNISKTNFNNRFSGIVEKSPKTKKNEKLANFFHEIFSKNEKKQNKTNFLVNDVFRSKLFNGLETFGAGKEIPTPKFQNLKEPISDQIEINNQKLGFFLKKNVRQVIDQKVQPVNLSKKPQCLYDLNIQKVLIIRSCRIKTS